MKTALTIIAIMTAVFLVVGMVSAAAPSTNYSVSFEGNVTSGLPPLGVKFTATANGFSPDTYDWSFGDNTGQIAGAVVSHTYSNPGIYDVKVTATDYSLSITRYAMATENNYITVFHPLPVASFSSSRTTVVGALMGADITFTSTSIGYIESYEWFIDNISAGTGSSITRSFPPVSAPETHEIKLRAFGDGGYDDSDVTVILVNPDKPVADFHASSTVGVKPFIVSFTDDSTGHGISSYNWGFGDGQFSNEQNPVHTYTSAGTYAVAHAVHAGIYGDDFIEKTAYITVLNTSTDICPPVPVCPEPTICPAPTKPIDTAATFKAGTWQLDPTTTSLIHFGAAGDIPVPADINGDGITDIGIFRPANGRWAYDTNGDGTVDVAFKFGMLGDLPVTGNFNNAGNTDIGIYRPSSAAWRFDYNLDGTVDDGFVFGNAGALPLVGNWQVPT